MIDLICQAQRWFCQDPDETCFVTPWLASYGECVLCLWRGREMDEILGPTLTTLLPGFRLANRLRNQQWATSDKIPAHTHRPER